jgi:hypothetical protein
MGLRNNLPDVLIRHSPPTKLDHAPFGTKCHVVCSLEATYDVYVQMSQQEDNPVWEFSCTERIQ